MNITVTYKDGREIKLTNILSINSVYHKFIVVGKTNNGVSTIEFDATCKIELTMEK